MRLLGVTSIAELEPAHVTQLQRLSARPTYFGAQGYL